MVSEATFSTNWGHICIEKWSQIFFRAPEVPKPRVRKMPFFLFIYFYFALLLLYNLTFYLQITQKSQQITMLMVLTNITSTQTPAFDKEVKDLNKKKSSRKDFLKR